LNRFGHTQTKVQKLFIFVAMTDPQQLLDALRSGDRRALARAITMVENSLPGASALLTALDLTKLSPVVGITGPPGAGKSTLINALITRLTEQGKTVAIIAVDPTSPFNFGSLLGDRLRMAEHFTNPNVYIRSLATRGSLGGLSAATLEITDVVRSAGFDLVIVETVGVGQSEVEIAGLADTTVVVLVPEAGDDVQAIKSGIMEIADIFVVNKADRSGAQMFARNLHQLLHQRAASDWTVPVIKTIAARNEGIDELMQQIIAHGSRPVSNPRRALLFAEKAWKLIQRNRMQDISRQDLITRITEELSKETFQLYRFANSFTKK
jgi:LAO/AO transport system kinase